MSWARFKRILRALNRVPKIIIPVLLFAVVWVIVGNDGLRDGFYRFVLNAYLVGIMVVGVAVGVTILAVSGRPN